MRYDGSRLRALRDSKGWARREVVIEMAERGAQVTEETLRRWEEGLTQPRADAMALLAEILECDVREFFAEEAIA